MKKLFAILLAIVMVATLCAGCGVEQASEESGKEWAMIRLPDGTIITGEGRIVTKSYSVVTIEINGVRYTTDYSNIVFVKEP